jgi:hypothetical protein
MKNRLSLGILIGTLWLLGIFALGAWAPGLDPVKIKLEDQPIKLPNVTKPELVRDRNEVLKLMNVARQVPKDFDFLIKQYDQIPPFNPNNRDPHMTSDQVGRFLLAYDSYFKEMDNFTKNTVGDNPGVFRALALAGMIQNFHEVVRSRALVRANMTAEEFDWIRVQLMQAGLFAVLSALDDGQFDSPEQKKHLESIRDQMYIASNIDVLKDDGTVTDHRERYQRFSIPRSNIVLFLDYYRRPNTRGINWPKIHFDRPTVITFNRETIMAKAVNNPP